MVYRIEHIPEASIMQAVVSELLPLVPFARRDKALRYKHLHGQYTCLRAWKLLHELLLAEHELPADLPLSKLTYDEDEYGKPGLTISADVCFSISHTKCALAVAIDHRPVGIDIENIVSLNRVEDAHFLERTMNNAERQLIHVAADPCMAFTELWTRKEALVKAIGTGLNMDTLPNLLSTLSDYTIQTFHSDIYACSIACIRQNTTC